VNQSQWLPRASFNGTGKHSMLVIGNSHADMFTEVISESFRSNYKTLDFFTIQSCLPFNITYPPPVFKDAVCQAYEAAALQLVKDTKPDILMIQFYWDSMGQPPITYPVNEDSIYQQIQTPLNEMAKHTKRIYFGAPYLSNISVDFYPSISILTGQQLWLDQPLDSLNFRLPEQLNLASGHYARMEALECEKCVVMDWTKTFCSRKTGMCPTHDPVTQISYLGPYAIHVNWYGAELALPLLQELSADLTQHGLTSTSLPTLDGGWSTFSSE